ncbi:Reverse transcriptase (RNA-dependent DNA polymerase) [Fragilaria crotonensis]|nr:Reverse transcriptase (RNA-dependent DNA polymerase) [Fragilaria crotonensis]
MEGWGEWKKRVRKYSIDPKYTEPYSPFQNKAELDIRELKRMIRRFQDKTRSPRRLWNYLVNLCANIRSFIAGTHPDLHGRSAFEQVHGWTPDISLYVMHGWYDVVAFLDNDNERKLACWLGPAEDYGGGDAVFLLPKSARPIVRSTVWALTPTERADRKDEIEDLLKSIDGKKCAQDEDAYYSTKAGPRPKRTTRGWRLLVEWNDGSSSWVSLADLKDSYPVQVADYAVVNNLTQEPAFRWWVPFVLKKRARILKKVKSKYWSTSHKYGLELPKSVAEALAIDKRTGTDFWRKAIEKEIRNVFPAFEFIEDDAAQVPPGYGFVDTYFVFDIKMDLTRKARLVARGSMTEATKEETFASVVSRDTVRLFFLLAALNDLELLSCDIQNAYLAAPNKEKVWTKFTDQLGPEYNGKRAIIAKALYDLWMRSALKPDGDKVYEYVISYVDDLIFQGINPKEFMGSLGQRFTLKPGSIKEPDTYLGVDVKKFRIPNSDDPDKVRWSFESTSYVKKAITDLEQELGEADLRLLPSAKTPCRADTDLN